MGTIKELQQALIAQAVPIVFLRTGELPYWDEDTPHAVIVVGITSNTLYVMDPAYPHAPIPTPIGDFQLAWDEFDGQWASIQCP